MPYETISATSPEAVSGASCAENSQALARILRDLFPSAVRDNRVDLDTLKQLLGEYSEQTEERFGLNWNGKKEARHAALTPSLGTLLPCKDDSVNWDTTKNLYIEGDNLEVLKLLKKSYSGKVKMIYIDPPYNTGKDFIYRDDFRDSLENYRKFTNQQHEYRANAEKDGRYHTRWLNMMYPRLLLARDFLTEDGVLFVSLDNSEIANFKIIADEVFGYENFVTILHVQMSTVQGEKVKSAKQGNIVKNAEYILVYSKNGKKNIAVNNLYDPVKYDNHYQDYLQEIADADGEYQTIKLSETIAQDKDVTAELQALSLLNKKGRLAAGNLQEAYAKSGLLRDFIHTRAKGIVRAHDSVEVPAAFKAKMVKGRVYRYKTDDRAYLVRLSGGGVQQLIPLSEKLRKADDFNETFGPTTIRGDWWPGFYLDMGNITKEGAVVFKNGKKPLRLISQLVYMTTQNNDIIMDFFSGSATTAHAVMQRNAADHADRRFILVQLPEQLDPKIATATADKNAIEESIRFLKDIQKPLTICEIGKERMRRAGKEISSCDTGFRVYKLADSNIKTWDPQCTDPAEAVLAHRNHLRPERSGDDLLAEIMLKSGIDLAEADETKCLAGHMVHRLGNGKHYACLEANIAEQAEELALGIAEWHTAGGAPQDTVTIFVLDEAFSGKDAAKGCFVKLLEQHGLSHVKAL